MAGRDLVRIHGSGGRIGKPGVFPGRMDTRLLRTKRYIPRMPRREMPGAWRSISTLIGAPPARSPARRRTTSGGRSRSGAAGARCIGSAWTATSGEPANPASSPPAGAVHALRECAMRDGLSRRGDGARPRGPECDGLQPLHRHPVLLEQLPLQSPPVQLPPVPDS